MKRFKFRGGDWTEVLEAIEGRKARKLDDDQAADRLRGILREVKLDLASRSKVAPRTRKIVKLCRAYVKKIASLKDGYDWPVFKGISEIESGEGDEMFIEYFRELFTWMWT